MSHDGLYDLGFLTIERYRFSLRSTNVKFLKCLRRERRAKLRLASRLAYFGRPIYYYYYNRLTASFPGQPG